MNELIRNLLLLAIAGAAVTLLGSAAAYWRDEERRLRRMLRRALGATPDMPIIAHGRGLAAGVSLDEGKVAVLWDEGMKGLVYRVDQLMGAELIVDEQVAARAFRGEPRRPLDQVAQEARRVMLRLVFDNPRHPDFELPLWPPADPSKIQRSTAFDAIQSARRWVSSVEALLRRSAPRAPAAAPQVAARPQPSEPVAEPRSAPPPAASPRPAEPPAPPLLAAMEQDDDPPWDDGEEDEDADDGAPRP